MQRILFFFSSEVVLGNPTSHRTVSAPSFSLGSFLKSCDGCCFVAPYSTKRQLGKLSLMQHILFYVMFFHCFVHLKHCCVCADFCEILLGCLPWSIVLLLLSLQIVEERVFTAAHCHVNLTYIFMFGYGESEYEVSFGLAPRNGELSPSNPETPERVQIRASREI